MNEFPQTDAVPSQPTQAQTGLSDNAAGAIAYITIIPAIVFLIVEPYSRNRYVRFHAWQSIFLSIAAFAIDTVLSFIPIVGWVILPVAMLGFLVVWIMALMKALKGERWMLPVIGKVAEQQAGY